MVFLQYGVYEAEQRSHISVEIVEIIEQLPQLIWVKLDITDFVHH